MFAIKNKGAWNRSVVLSVIYMCLTSFVLTRGVFLIYLTSVGLTAAEVSLYQTVFFLSVSVFEVPTGFFGDKYGNERSLFCGSLCLACHSVLMISGTNTLYFLCMALLEALGYTFISGSDKSMFYIHLENSGRSADYLKTNAKVMFVQSVITSAAIFIGSIIATVSWVWLYCMTAAIFLASAIVSILLQKSDVKRQEERKEVKFSLRSILGSIRFKPIAVFFVLLILMSCLEGFFLTYYNFNQIIFDSFGLNLKTIGLFFSVLYLINSLAYLLPSVLSKWVKKKRSIYLSILALESLLFFLLAMNLGGKTVLFISGVILFLPEILNLINENFIQENITSKYRATLLSFYSLIVSLGSSIMYAGLGYSFEHVSFPRITTSIGLSLSIFGILFVYFGKRLDGVHSRNIHNT